MTAATSGRSDGAIVSRSTIEAIVSTSYGVRFFSCAYRRLTVLHCSQNVCSWSATSRLDVVLARNSYVAGKRKPSRFARLRGTKQETTPVRVARV